LFFFSIIKAYAVPQDDDAADITDDGGTTLPAGVVCFLKDFYADGYCDAKNNVAGCQWDGGDCCESTCGVDYDTVTTCGTGGVRIKSVLLYFSFHTKSFHAKSVDLNSFDCLGASNFVYSTPASTQLPRISARLKRSFQMTTVLQVKKGSQACQSIVNHQWTTQVTPKLK